MKAQKKSGRISRVSSAPNISGVVDPAQLVRIEAQALLALADRLEGDATSAKSMAEAFARAVDLIVACGIRWRARRGHRHGQERNHRAENCRDA